MPIDRPLTVLRGGGDLGTGGAIRLHRAGWRILVTELPQPLAIRRAVAFASAMYTGSIEVEGVVAHKIDHLDQAAKVWANNHIPVITDPDRLISVQSQPAAIVDAIMSKMNTGTRLTEAPIVVALGPGFTAGIDCHAVVETNRGHNLGRVYYRGAAEPDRRIDAITERVRPRTMRLGERGDGDERISIHDASGDLVNVDDGRCTPLHLSALADPNARHLSAESPRARRCRLRCAIRF